MSVAYIAALVLVADICQAAPLENYSHPTSRSPRAVCLDPKVEQAVCFLYGDTEDVKYRIVSKKM